MKLLRHTRLRFKQEKSDKVYEVDLVETAGDYLVNFRYGRVATTLREGCKTKYPVDLSHAIKIADSLLVNKINKGYYVVAGFDPIAGELIDDQPSPLLALPLTETNQAREQKILLRLEKFCHGNQYLDDAKALNKAIDGYSLSRSLWKAGELRISPMTPVIKTLLAISLNEPKTTYYSMLWALGRSGEAEGLALIDELKNKLPKHTAYMLTEVKMALSSQPNYLIPNFDNSLDRVATATQVALFDDIENMSFNPLEPAQRAYIKLVTDLHNISSDIEVALGKINIEDYNEGNQQHYVNQYLAEETRQILKASDAAFPQLQVAIDALLEHQKNHLISKKTAQYQADFDLYQSLLSNINLSRILGSDYYINTIEEGRLSWIWGSEKKKFRKALIVALKKSGSRRNIQSLWQCVENYADIKSNQDETYSSEQTAEFQKIITDANVNDDVNKAVQTYKLDDYSYTFKQSHLSLETKAKYENNLFPRVLELFHDKFHQLRLEALKPKKALLKKFQKAVLGVYWQSLVEPSQRAMALVAIKNTPVKAPFTQTFRRLYKLAEFRDDAEVLGVLNHRLESTPPSQYNYWQPKKPFSKATKEYFRKRMVRRLQNIAKFNPQSYTKTAKYLLLQADDNDALTQYSKARQLSYFPRLHALNFILHQNSQLFSKNYINIWSLVKNNKIQETIKPEAYSKLWDHADDDLWSLLLDCKAQLVNNFSYNKLYQNTVFLQNATQQDWIKLVQKPYENTALLAIEHLSSALTELDVMKAVLVARFSTVRERALQALDGESLGDHCDLLLLMLLSEHNDVYDFATRYLYSAQAHYALLSDQLINELLKHQSDDKDKKEAQSRRLARIEWLLLHPLKGCVSLDKITELLADDGFELQFLASKLLEVSAYSFAEIEPSYQLMSQSEYPEIKAGAIALLAKLSQQQQIEYKPLLLSALLDKHGRLREKSRKIVIAIDNQNFRQTVFNHVLPSFFKAEPVEGFADDMLELVVGLSPLHPDIDSNLLWRLLNAKSKLAEWVGAIILPARQASEFSVKQLSLLTKNPTLSVRDWALDAFDADLRLTTAHYSHAIRILDNRWDDSRQRAISFFKDNFEQDFWNTQRTIAVCDNVYPDVQKFGRDLVTRFFNQDQGEEYLIKLSQHPSANVQLFVSGFLKEYATNQPRIILSLAPYFNTVLSQINRGRLVKDRIINFLFTEATKDQEVAKMVAELFSDQSISMVIADKMQYIKTLFKLQTQFQHIKTPVQSIEPEVRAI